MIIIITTTFTLIIHMVEDGSSRVLDCGARCVVVLLAHVSDDAVSLRGGRRRSSTETAVNVNRGIVLSMKVQADFNYVSSRYVHQNDCGGAADSAWSRR